VDNGNAAAQSIQPLIVPGRPFDADKLEDLVKEGVVLRDPSSGAVRLVGDLLSQAGDVVLVVIKIGAQVFEEVHIVEGNVETVLLGFDVRQNKALIVKIHDVFAQDGKLVDDPLTVGFNETRPA